MTSFKQIEANRRNALKSTGPTTVEGKRRSSQNATRHGLTAETAIVSLEDLEDYKGFELAVTADYQGETAVERELVLRLASLLWRLRRATAVETGLFQIQAEVLEKQRRACASGVGEGDAATASRLASPRYWQPHQSVSDECGKEPSPSASEMVDLARCFLHLSNLDNAIFERLSRYEMALWRQTRQVMFSLELLKKRNNRLHQGQPYSWRSFGEGLTTE